VLRAGELRPPRIERNALLEKIALVSMVSVIFAQILPGVQASVLQLTVAVAVIVTANAFFSQWLASRGTAWFSALREFAMMAVVNLGIVLAYAYVLRRSDGDLDVGATLFFVLLLTLIVTLFDRYRHLRYGSEEQSALRRAA
jgi:hypothetical protein